MKHLRRRNALKQTKTYDILTLA